MLTDKQQKQLEKIPGVDALFEKIIALPDVAGIPKSVIVNAVRQVMAEFRIFIVDHAPTSEVFQKRLDNLPGDAVRVAGKTSARKLIRTVNATGVVIHTNQGRSLLADKAIENLTTIAGNYSNLEYDLSSGNRGSRYDAVADLICELSGAEAAMVVNNNAAAVLVCLETLAKNREAIVSRGELVEIGGSFRIPDIMAKSGARLREVGTTNRTHPRDYRDAIGNDTGLLLKVHRSNFSIEGFTREVGLRDLVALGTKNDLPVMEDLGSGMLVDFSRFGLIKEPTVQESVDTGVDVVTFSGDKLLGGPQAGIIAGKKSVIERIRKNPLCRALRIDKLTLAALESTLRLYREPEKAVQYIPTLRMITMTADEIDERANHLSKAINELEGQRLYSRIVGDSSRTGGGSLPAQSLPTKCVAVQIDGHTPNTIEKKMRAHTPPVIGRIFSDMFLLDVRTIKEHDIGIIVSALQTVLERIKIGG